MSLWSAWSECDTQTALKHRERGVKQPPAHGGVKCPTSLAESADCAVHCKSGPWSAWTSCATSGLDKGTRARVRAMISEARNNGLPCTLKEVEHCTFGCQVSLWGAWELCRELSWMGMQLTVKSRHRSIVVQPPEGSGACPMLVQNKQCNTVPLYVPTPSPNAIDCTLGNWFAWSACNTTTGMQDRNRPVSVSPANGGRSCGPITEERDCAVHCEVGSWGPWTDMCVAGLRQRERPEIVSAKNGGKACTLIETEKCASDCVIGVWDTWSPCSALVWMGMQFKVQSRHRQVLAPPFNGGMVCPPTMEHKPCATGPQPAPTPPPVQPPTPPPTPASVDCEVSTWFPWSACDLVSGQRRRARMVLVRPANGGQGCPTALTEVDECDVHCQTGPWSTWSPCAKAGDSAGSQHRTRMMVVAPKNNGRQCTLVEEAQCIVDCETSAWGTWSECHHSNNTAASDQAIRTRNRAVLIHPRNGGSICPTLQSQEVCPTPSPTASPSQAPTGVPSPAMVDCVLSVWGGWSTCAPETHTRSRARTVVISHAFGGNPCEDLTQQQDCAEHCSVEPWGSWGDCQHSGDNAGRKKRSRALIPATRNKGRPCVLEEWAKCVVDCDVSQWGEWSQCNAITWMTLQFHVRARNRHVVTEPINGGTPCPVLLSQERCSVATTPTPTASPTPARVSPTPAPTTLLPGDCVVSGWTNWTTCDAKSATQLRQRTVVVAPTDGGRACPTTLGEMRECALHCKTGPWSDWSVCEQTGSAAGTTRRTRTKVTTAQNDSLPCTLVDVQPCVVPCQVSDWSEWSICQRGRVLRFRSIEVDPVNGGALCPALKDEQSCATPAPAPTPPVDCEVTQWTPWSVCSEPCGSGVRMRFRQMTTAPQNGGSGCPSLRELNNCNQHKCVRDCQFTWDKWGACTESCGSGVQLRQPKIVHWNSHGGQNCPSRQERICNTGACPHAVPTPVPTPSAQELLDCTVSEFTPWSVCSEVCGGGLQIRFRWIVRPRRAGGKACPSLRDSHDCNTQPCAIDCQFHWSAWGGCSHTCGGGTQERLAVVTRQPRGGGMACPERSERVCNAHDCATPSPTPRPSPPATSSPTASPTPLPPVNCAVGSWSLWSACSEECLGGVRMRFRAIVSPAMHGGTKCPDTRDVRACNAKPCPVHCENTWKTWSNCSKPCGTGSQTREAVVTRNASLGGDECPQQQDRVCNVHACPTPAPTTAAPTQAPTQSPTASPHRDCQVTAFYAWSKCSAWCGGGTKLRARKITRYPLGNGTACPSLTQRADCQTQGCRVSCQYTWGPWSTCSSTCGWGSMTRHPIVTQGPRHGGRPCPKQADSSCSVRTCPTPAPAPTAAPTNYPTYFKQCKVHPWSRWSVCSEPCAGGIQMRLRRYVSGWSPNHGASNCPAIRDERDCNTAPCKVHCEYSWQPWTQCTKTCGKGTQHRQPNVTVQGQHGGDVCPRHQERTCTNRACPTPAPTVAPTASPTPAKIDCSVGDWSSWSLCSENCGGGVQVRFRRIRVDPAFGGKSCPSVKVERNCNVQSCPTHCSFNWGGWDACSVSCGTGIKTRQANVNIYAANGGKECPKEDEETCMPTQCPTPAPTAAPTVAPTPLHVDCVMQQWSLWSLCSEECGGGVQLRHRSVLVAQEGTGKPCPVKIQTQNCNAHHCPVDCDYTWGNWTACSKSCGAAGVRSRTVAAVHKKDAHGGNQCPVDQDEVCMLGPCPTAAPTPESGNNCAMSTWSTWSQCSEECGSGVQLRYRKIVRDAVNDGKPCPSSLRALQNCNTHQCPVDCEFTWSAWGACRTSCGVGTQSRKVAKIETEHAHGGKPCPTDEDRVCPDQPVCPTPSPTVSPDCEVSSWSLWSQCTEKCRSGVQMRLRTILRDPQIGGKACPGLKEMRDCNVHRCPLDCHYKWLPWSSCSKTCGDGIESRTADVHTHNEPGGKECPQDQDRVCNLTPNCTTATAPPTPPPVPCVDSCPSCCKSGLEKYCFGNEDKTTQAHAQRVCRKSCALCEAPAATPAPSPPTSASASCSTVFGLFPNGWHGRGFGGNYCNLCFCVNGDMLCSKKTCLAVDADATPHPCSDVTCKPVYNAITGETLVKVHHGNRTEQRGNRHHCSYSRPLRECSCVCWGAVTEYQPALQALQLGV
jgi:hypothetical protein